MRTCSTCKFWQGYSDDGACHRYPPTPMPGGAFDVDRAKFPDVRKSDWCGEHKTGPKFLYSKEPA